MKHKVILVCLMAVIACVLAGCGGGGADKPLSEQTDYARYFAKKQPVPKDRSVRLAVYPAANSFVAGGPVDLNLDISNMASTKRALPLGTATETGGSYTFFSALIRDEANHIERAIFTTTDEGKTVWLELDKYETRSELIPLGECHPFEQPGVYTVILFYTVEKNQVAGDRTPDWTGTVWSAPITIIIE